MATKDIDLELHEFGTPGLGHGPAFPQVAKLEQDVFPFDIAEIAQTLLEGSRTARRRRTVCHDESYPWDFSGCCASTETHRAKAKHSARSPPFWIFDSCILDFISDLDPLVINTCPNRKSKIDHLITFSARIITTGGIVKPSALAVLRLITSSNLVGCSTGRSAGLVPFRILSTIDATRL